MSSHDTLRGRLLDVLLAILTVGSPGWAFAQQMDPNMQMPMSMPMPAEKPNAAPKKPATAHPKKAAHISHNAHQATAVSKPAPHDMDMPGMAPVTGGSDMGDMPGMDMTQPAAVAPNAPRTPIPVLTDADRQAARPPMHGHPAHDNNVHNLTVIDRLETWNANDGGALVWNGRVWIGTDLNRLWLRSEGERVGGRTDAADLEVLYGHSVSTWWDVVAGVRHDFKPGASQDFAAVGVTGVAPYKFHVNATAYLGQSGQTGARLEGEYESLLTNRLILQPRVEANFWGQDDARRGIGSGLSTIEAGLRLRYEINRRFAPYIGITRERAFGSTARFRRDAGQDINDTRFVAGLRLWF
jgi:copper resistance protein B